MAHHCNALNAERSSKTNSDY